MELDFHKIKVAVERQFGETAKHDLFRTGAEKDAMWSTYLTSFPAGTNPMFRARTQHDCSCCRQFIRTVGNVVAIVNNEIVSIWDCAANIADPAYKNVVRGMSQLVKSHPIENVFLHYEKSIGTDRNFEDDKGRAVEWNHFHVDIPHRNQRTFIAAKKDIPTKLGKHREHYDVLERSLRELTMDSVDTVLELIAQNSLYRGAEHKFAVDGFRKLKSEYDKLEPRFRGPFVWSISTDVTNAVARIRNTAIGTLLVDLSAGLDLENAVRKFEAMVAPTNYKRPTALVTKSMVDAARKQIDELGLTSSLERRYASLSDININNIIFANRQSRKNIKGDVFDDIQTKPVSAKSFSKIETVAMDTFIEEIVPHVSSIEIMVENKHESNLVSLIAPVDAGAKPLFKWDNNFSWAYKGDVADSIKERVKQAGGNVTGDLCCRLAWHNFDDLDLHMNEPGGLHIFFATPISPWTGGRLDVDMNAGTGRTREPVENIFYQNRGKMREGTYTLSVNQYCARETTNVGFEIEIDIMGQVTKMVYDTAVRDRDTIRVAKINVQKHGIEIIESLPASTASKTLWNMTTQTFHPVNVFLHSPNYWGEPGIGNKHYFFMVDGCVNDGQARGFFNEFLRSDLDKHRKVIEIVGGKMRTAETPNQLSGLGFSETKRDEIVVRVDGKFTRTLRVVI
jgi:hypothetical protein